MKGIIFTAGLLIGWLFAVSQREEAEAPQEVVPVEAPDLAEVLRKKAAEGREDCPYKDR